MVCEKQRVRSAWNAIRLGERFVAGGTMKFYAVIALFNAFLWVTLSAMTIGGIVLNPIGWPPNVIIGSVFAAIGVFFYWKARYFQKFMATQAKDVKLNRFLQKFLALDRAFALVSLLFVIVLNVAASTRVFGEHVPIFG